MNKTKKSKSKFDWLKKNIVIVPVVGAILAGTVTSVRYVFTMTDTIQVNKEILQNVTQDLDCLLYTSPSPRDGLLSRMPSSA